MIYGNQFKGASMTLTITKALKGIPLIALAALSQSCKPAKIQSELASLENLAAGEVLNVNFCSSSREEVIRPERAILADRVITDAKTSQDHKFAAFVRREAIAALTSVPTNVQQMFLTLGGTINLHQDVARRCSGALPRPDPRVTACVVLGADPDIGGAQSLDIYLLPDPIVIRHELVRQMGYFLSQIAPRIDPINQSPGTITTQANEPEKFVQIKNSLLNAYKEDLEGNAKAFAERKQAFANSNAAALRDFVFAEAFDSYHCNSWGDFDPKVASEILSGALPVTEVKRLKNSRKLMQTFFPKTYLAFEQSMRSMNLLRADISFALAGEGNQVVDEPLSAAPTVPDLAPKAPKVMQPATIANEAIAANAAIGQPALAQHASNGKQELAGFLANLGATKSAQKDPITSNQFSSSGPSNLMQRVSTTSCHPTSGACAPKPELFAGISAYTRSVESQKKYFSDLARSSGDTQVAYDGISIEKHQYIPRNYSDGTPLGKMMPGPLGETNYFSAPNPGELAAGDGRGPGEPGTSRVNLGLEFDRNGICRSADGYCDASHRKVTWGWNGWNDDRQLPPAVPTIDAKTGIGTNSAKIGASAFYPYNSLAPWASAEISAKTERLDNGVVLYDISSGREKFPSSEDQLKVRRGDKTYVYQANEYNLPPGSSPTQLIWGITDHDRRKLAVMPNGQVYDTRTGRKLEPVRIDNAPQGK
jgi:hypothetical protein